MQKRLTLYAGITSGDGGRPGLFDICSRGDDSIIPISKRGSCTVRVGEDGVKSPWRHLLDLASRQSSVATAVLRRGSNGGLGMGEAREPRRVGIGSLGRHVVLCCGDDDRCVVRQGKDGMCVPCAVVPGQVQWVYSYVSGLIC